VNVLKRFALILVAAGIFVSCTERSASIYTKPTDRKDDIDEGNETIDDFSPQADILFVVDNSGSMSTHQANLAANIPQFTGEFFRAPILDYHIAVVSTDVDGFASPCCGKFAGSVKVVDKRTPNADAVLASNLKLGINGSGTEQPFQAVRMAMDPALLATDNAGFARKHSAFVAIFITDAEDQSTIDPQGLYNFILQMKGNRKKKAFAFGALIPTTETNCDRDAFQPPTLIEQFLGMFPLAGSNEMNLCAPDFGKRLAEAAASIVNEVGNKIYLSRRPDIQTLRVTYGAADLPNNPRNGWTFDPRENAIVLGRDIDWDSQPPDSEVKVHYTAATGEIGN
jgi:hypothetical protein